MTLNSPLPAITDALDIDGSTQSGFNGEPVIDLRSGGLSVLSTGLSVEQGDTGVIGLSFTRFEAGIRSINGGASLFVDRSAFTSINGVAIDAFMNTNAGFSVKDSKFLGGMDFGTKVLFGPGSDVSMRFSGNFMDGVDTGFFAEETLGAKGNWTVFDNTVTNGTIGGSVILRGEAERNLTNNDWTAAAQANFKIFADVAPDLRSTLTLDGEFMTGSDVDNIQASMNIRGELAFNIWNLTAPSAARDHLRMEVVGGLGGHLDFTTRDSSYGFADAALRITNGSTILNLIRVEVQTSEFDHIDDVAIFPLGIDLRHTITGCTFTNCGTGVRVGSFTEANIVDNVFSENERGVEVLDSAKATLTNNEITGSSSAGVAVEDQGQATLTGNVITGNGLGLLMLATGAGTSLAANSIFGNLGLGIDLNNDGVTLNDPLDADSGPNGLQNYPVLTSAQTSGSATAIAGSLNSTPNSSFTLLFFSNTSPDPSGFGEGEIFVGSQSVSTNGSGNAAFAFNTTTAVALGRYISALAVGALGNTSEFSQVVQVQAGSTPVVQVALLSAKVTGFVNTGALPAKEGEHLKKDLVKADKDLKTNKPKQAVQDLTNFVNEVGKVRKKGNLSNANANSLINDANKIIADIGKTKPAIFGVQSIASATTSIVSKSTADLFAPSSASILTDELKLKSNPFKSK